MRIQDMGQEIALRAFAGLIGVELQSLSGTRKATFIVARAAALRSQSLPEGTEREIGLVELEDAIVGSELDRNDLPALGTRDKPTGCRRDAP